MRLGVFSNEEQAFVDNLTTAAATTPAAATPAATATAATTAATAATAATTPAATTPAATATAATTVATAATTPDVVRHVPFTLTDVVSLQDLFSLFMRGGAITTGELAFQQRHCSYLIDSAFSVALQGSKQLQWFA